PLRQKKSTVRRTRKSVTGMDSRVPSRSSLLIAYRETKPTPKFASTAFLTSSVPFIERAARTGIPLSLSSDSSNQREREPIPGKIKACSASALSLIEVFEEKAWLGEKMSTNSSIPTSSTSNLDLSTGPP